MRRNTWTNGTATVTGLALHKMGRKHDSKRNPFNYILQIFMLKFYAPWDPQDQTQERNTNTDKS